MCENEYGHYNEVEVNLQTLKFGRMFAFDGSKQAHKPSKQARRHTNNTDHCARELFGATPPRPSRDAGDTLTDGERPVGVLHQASGVAVERDALGKIRSP